METQGTILVSDRNKGLQTAIVLFLQKEFSSIITETEPEKIIGLAQKDSIDIIVLDSGSNTVSEQKNCIDLIRQIANLNKNIQVIVLTNFGQNSFAMECIEAGAFDFITKPWNNEKLLVTAKNALKLKSYSNALSDVGILKDSGYSDNNIEDEHLEKEYRKTVGKRVITLEQMEMKMIEAALKRNKGNISVAAAELGITRQTLYNKGKKHNLFK
ncbi:MAG: response regulator [Bacteroidales bacterium]|nr:response regulator [Bacteroidales bacterium]